MSSSALLSVLLSTIYLSTLLAGCSSNDKTSNTTTTAPTTTPAPTSTTAQSFCGSLQSPVPSTVKVTLDANGDMSFHVPVMGDPVADLKYEYDDSGRDFRITNVNTSSSLSDFNFKFALPNPSVKVQSTRGEESMNFTLGWFPTAALSRC
ncbi:hypothetical protein FOZ61_007894 [Perkinsus olseni]|uniref:Uncharacterized protein n=1 Tax=Perkinsus olseni TaxID=32597 RepID=A0A7J6MUJ1_PEROL|nr:hypothetical protein FOZ61_007894 [Perkinsus olseni]KAF4675275.1 hypothetical protein FOL46_002215 [Perkinsus olseni]